MKLNIGAGALQLDGFQNVDVRAVGKDVRRGHAGDLAFAADGAVDVVFSHAVFEHVYPAHRLAVLREWKRVLARDGVAVCIGLPDFETIAAAYVAGAPGATGPTFDLFEVYRYTHGHPEHQTDVVWPDWDPARRANATPPGYAPQLHKGLFDLQHLSNLLRRVGVEASILRYAYPREEPRINLGFVVGAGCSDHTAAQRHLLAIPNVDRFIRDETLTWHELLPLAHDRFLDEVERLEQRPPPQWRRAATRGRRFAGRALRVAKLR